MCILFLLLQPIWEVELVHLSKTRILVFSRPKNFHFAKNFSPTFTLKTPLPNPFRLVNLCSPAHLIIISFSQQTFPQALGNCKFRPTSCISRAVVPWRRIANSTTWTYQFLAEPEEVCRVFRGGKGAPLLVRQQQSRKDSHRLFCFRPGWGLRLGGFLELRANLCAFSVGFWVFSVNFVVW
jgi:hypothetical protein